MLHGAGRFIYKFTSNIWAKSVGKYLKKPWSIWVWHQTAITSIGWGPKLSRKLALQPMASSSIPGRGQSLKHVLAVLFFQHVGMPVLLMLSLPLLSTPGRRTIFWEVAWTGPAARQSHENELRSTLCSGWLNPRVKQHTQLGSGQRACIFWMWNKWHTATLGLASTCANHGCLHGKRLNMWWITGMWRSLMCWIPNVGNWADRS